MPLPLLISTPSCIYLSSKSNLVVVVVVHIRIFVEIVEM